MTAREFAERILALPPEKQELQLFVSNSASDQVNKLSGHLRVDVVSQSDRDDSAELEELQVGAEYLTTGIC